MSVLQSHYTIFSDWSGKRYLGLDLDWDCAQRKVHPSMLSYVLDALKRFHHKHAQRPQDQPHPYIKPTYRAKAQFIKDINTSPLVSEAEKTFVQEVTGTFLHYDQAVDATTLPALGTIVTQQASPTEQTMAKVNQFLEYSATHPDDIITYHASDTVLVGHSDASYLSESKVWSRAG